MTPAYTAEMLCCMKREFLALFAIPFLCMSATAADDSDTNNNNTAEADPKRNWALVPAVTSSPSFGSGLGLTGLYFFKLDKQNEATPPSRIFASVVYSDTDSYAAIVVPSFYFSNDDRRFEIPMIHGRVNNEIDDYLTGQQARFESKFSAIAPVYRWRIKGRTYLGAQVQISDVAYSARDAFSDDYLERIEAEDTTQTGIGTVLTRDSRDNQLYPYSGSYAEINALVYTGMFGNDSRYETVKAEFKKFHELGREKILAWRIYGQFGFGDTDYASKAKLGRGADLRGYTSGEHFADNMMTVQAEYRWMPWRRVGLVGFAGYSALYDDDWYDLNDADYYGSFGVGLRLRILESERVNFRVDWAWGEDEDAYYVSLRESF